MWYAKSFLPTVGVIMSYPLWLLNIVQEPRVPVTAIEAQGWLIAVVGAAMGLIKIALWLRNYKEQKNGNGETNGLQRILDKVAVNEDKLVENQKTLSENQQRLLENQLKALDNHGRLLEAITLMRMQLQNMENTILSSQDRRTLMALSELKEFIRDSLGEK